MEGSGPGAPGQDGLVLLLLMVAGAAAAVGILLRRGEFRADRMTARRAAAPAPARPIGAILLAIGLAAWLAWQVGGSIAIGAAGSAPSSLRSLGVASAGAYAGGFLALAIGIAALRRADHAVSPLGPARPADALWGVGLLLLIYPLLHVSGVISLAIAGEVARITGAPPPDTVAHTTLRLLFGESVERGVWWWAAAVSAGVVAPVFEEALYRACLQGGITEALWRGAGPDGALRKRSAAVWSGIVSASAIFAAVHAPSASLHALPTLFLFGVSLGVVYERFGRVWPGAALHAAFNILNLVIAARGA